MAGINNFLSSIPLVGGLFDDSEDQALEQLRRNQALYENLNLPSTEWDNYTPEEYQYAVDFNPKLAEYETIKDSPELRMKQQAYLESLQQLADKGLSAEDELGFQRARDLGSETSRRGTLDVIADARRRGVSGGGLEFALREQANQAGAKASQDAGLNRAAEAARQRALYQQAYGGALSGQRN